MKTCEIKSTLTSKGLELSTSENLKKLENLLMTWKNKKILWTSDVDQLVLVELFDRIESLSTLS